MLIAYLLTFLWAKPLILVLIVCMMIMRIILDFLFNVATKELSFMFNNKSYKQVDSVAIGSPLVPALTKIFICNFESK